MPVQFYNLGHHVFHGDQSQVQHNLQLQAARAGAEGVRDQDVNKAREEGSKAVQESKEAEQDEIQGEGQGENRHASEQRKGEQTPPEEPPPEDPTGKGRFLDINV